MPGRDFTTVALPNAVADRIDAELAADRTYRSRGELVKAAVLQYLARRATVPA